MAWAVSVSPPSTYVWAAEAAEAGGVAGVEPSPQPTDQPDSGYWPAPGAADSGSVSVPPSARTAVASAPPPSAVGWWRSTTPPSLFRVPAWWS